MATRIHFEPGRPVGVLTDKGELIHSDEVIYSGTVWNLYGKLIEAEHTTPERIRWAKSQKPTYPSVVLYAIVDHSVIPEDTQPVEMLVGNPDRIDESEVTAYIPSIDDRTLCAEDAHVIAAIGPTFEQWTDLSDMDYREMKQKEQRRLIKVLAHRFPGLEHYVRYTEVATPRRWCQHALGIRPVQPGVWWPIDIPGVDPLPA